MDKTQFRLHPTDDHIVLEPKKDAEKTKSGLYIPPTASKERPQEGLVLAVGPGKLSEKGERMPMGVKVGDRVLFSKYGPTEVKLDDQELLILNQSDVLAVIEE